MSSVKRIAVNARVAVDGSEFVVLDSRDAFAHAEPYRTVQTGCQYELMHARDGWRYWAVGSGVERQNPNAPRQ